MLDIVKFPRLAQTHYGRLVQNPTGRLANDLTFTPEAGKTLSLVTPLSLLQQIKETSLGDYFFPIPVAGQGFSLVPMSALPVEVNYLLDGQMVGGRLAPKVKSLSLEGTGIVNIVTYGDLPVFSDQQVDVIFEGALASICLTNKSLFNCRPEFWRERLKPLAEFFTWELPEENCPFKSDERVRRIFNILAGLSPSQRTHENFEQLKKATEDLKSLTFLFEKTSEGINQLAQEIQRMTQDPRNYLLEQRPVLAGFMDDLILYGLHRQAPAILGEPFYYSQPLALYDFVKITGEAIGAADYFPTVTAFMVSEIWPLMNSLLIRRNLIRDYLRSQGN